MIALAILAAGESSRLGCPKQLLDLDGRPLLEHIIEAGLNSSCQQVFVVLGANADLVQDALSHKKNATVIHNPDWQSGMASSIKAVVNHLCSSQIEVGKLILCTCDQPFLSSEILDKLISESTKSCKIVASAYDDACGVPALFKRELFPELSSLDGTHGARRIIQKNIASVIRVDFAEGAIDIDTEEDWMDFKRRRAALKSSSI